MPAYDVVLGNPFRFQIDWSALGQNIRDLFSPVVQQSARYNDVAVRVAESEGDIPPGSLLIYIVGSRSESIIQRHFGAQADPTHNGLTYFRNGGEAISEVYIATMTDLRLAARIAYHEAMHNLLRLGNSLHSQGGLAAAMIGVNTQRSAPNDQAMANALATTGPQWPGGFSIGRQLESDLQDL